MKQIFKYDVLIKDKFNVSIPKGAEFLSVQVQHDKPVMWFLLESTIEYETRRFLVIGTGRCFHYLHDHESCKYLGTFQLLCDEFVGHLFEREDRK